MPPRARPPRKCSDRDTERSSLSPRSLVARPQSAAHPLGTLDTAPGAKDQGTQTSDSSRVLKNRSFKGIDMVIPTYYDAPDRHGKEHPDARRRSAARVDVQLRHAGSARPRRSSAATDPPDDRRGAGSRLSPRFDRLYATTGRPSIPPEQLLRALLLQMLYSIRSERLLVEELDYSVLYRWFVGLSLDDPIWDATTFTKNRDRLSHGDIADAFFAEVLAAITRGRPPLGRALHGGWHAAGGVGESQELQAEGRGPRRRPTIRRIRPSISTGSTRRNDTHQSTTDPDARLYKKAVGPRSQTGLSRRIC